MSDQKADETSETPENPEGNRAPDNGSPDNVDHDSDGGIQVDVEGGNQGTYDIGDRESGSAGLPDKDEVPPETIEEIEEERKKRLDFDNRPDGAEVDNSDRTFDAEAGMFTDNEEYDENNKPYADDPDAAAVSDTDDDSSEGGANASDRDEQVQEARAEE